MGKNNFDTTMAEYNEQSLDGLWTIYKKNFNMKQPSLEEFEAHNRYKENLSKNTKPSAIDTLYEHAFQQNNNGDYSTKNNLLEAATIYTNVYKRLNERNGIVKFFRSLFGFDKEEKALLSKIEEHLFNRGITKENLTSMAKDPSTIDSFIESNKSQLIRPHRNINRFIDAELLHPTDKAQIEQELREKYIYVQTIQDKNFDTSKINYALQRDYVNSEVEKLPKSEDFEVVSQEEGWIQIEVNDQSFDLNPIEEEQPGIQQGLYTTNNLADEDELDENDLEDENIFRKDNDPNVSFIK